MDQKAIENELNCSICLETYTDPKILQCFHIYCQTCLVKLVVEDQQGQLSLSCPICRQVTPVPASGTAGLQSAFHINRLLEILDQHKKTKGEAEKADRKAESSAPHSSNVALCCSEHGGREVELFCETCGELICSMCAIKGGKHHSHDYTLINESFERYREQVTPLLEPMEKKLATITKVLSQLDKQCRETTDQQTAVEASIRDGSKQLHEIIEKREKELIGQLEQVTRRKLKGFATQRDQIETLQAQLSSCLEFTRESLKAETQHPEVLAMKTGILKQVGELTTASQSDILTLGRESSVVFSGLADTAAVCESYGGVYMPNSPDTLTNVATGRGIKEAVVGEKAAASFSAISSKGEPCNDVSVKLESEITRYRVECRMESKGQGQYMISYQPTVKGRHQLLIKADGQHIEGSPFSISVKLPVEKIGTPILSMSGVLNPWGVAITGKGEVLVAEGGADCVSVFSPSGRKLRSFGQKGSGEGQFWVPSGVAVDREGNILVADKLNHRLQKFRADGRFLKAIGRGGKGTLQFNQPCGVAYNPDYTRVYVVDGENCRIHVLDSEYVSVSIFGKQGSGEGEFSLPCDVAVDNTGRVYVADGDNHRIQVFTAEGRFLRQFGKKGMGREDFCFPVGITVDASGFVYVSDYNNHRVSLFTSEGKFVSSFWSIGKEPGRFTHPLGLAVDDSGVVYVSDYSNNRIQVF